MRAFFTASLLIAFVAACSSSSSSSSATGGGVGGDDASGGSGGAPSSATSTAAGTGGGSVSEGEACETGDCDVGLFCDFLYHACTFQGPGLSGESYAGECRVIPTSCSDGAPGPACGCDGVVYSSECEAHQAGIDVGHQSCSPDATPEGHFPCGTLYCDPTVEWCWMGEGDVEDVDYQCRSLPAACGGELDCACLEGLTLEGHCSVVEGNGVSGLSVLEPLI